MPGMSVENPLAKLTKLGRLSPTVPDREDSEASNDIQVFYEVYNVGDAHEKKLLCEAKQAILKYGYPYSEQTSFDTKGNFFVALNWYREVPPTDLEV